MARNKNHRETGWLGFKSPARRNMSDYSFFYNTYSNISSFTKSFLKWLLPMLITRLFNEKVKILLKSHFTCWQLYLFPLVYFLLAFPFFRLTSFFIAYGWAKIYGYELNEVVNLEILFGFTGRVAMNWRNLGVSGEYPIGILLIYSIVMLMAYPFQIATLLIISYYIKAYDYLKSFFIYPFFFVIIVVVHGETAGMLQGVLLIFHPIDVQGWARENWVESVHFIFMLIYCGFCAILFRYIVLKWGVNRRFLKYSK